MIVLVIFWGVQLAVLGLIVATVRRPEVGRKGLLLLLSALPLLPCLLWGRHFVVTPGTLEPVADWISGALMWFLLASVAISVGLVCILRGARPIAAVIGLVEVASTFLAAIFAAMQVTGNWI